MTPLVLEVVEGPDAGRQLTLQGAAVIGRAADAQLVLDDRRVSRHHVRVTPQNEGALVEDLESANGTFVNHHEIHGPQPLSPGDELLVGTTLLQLRTEQEVARVPSAVRAVPPALAASRTPPTPASPPEEGVPEDPVLANVDLLLDTRVKMRARLAPLAIFVLVALAALIYFATR